MLQCSTLPTCLPVAEALVRLRQPLGVNVPQVVVEHVRTQAKGGPLKESMPLLPLGQRVPVGRHVVLRRVRVRERHGSVRDVLVPVRLGALDLDRIGLPSRYALPQPNAPAQICVRSRDGHNRLGVQLGEERRREPD